MGIDIKEEYGGQGGTFFQSVLAIEELAKVDPSASVIVDVQNTLVSNAIERWGNRRAEAELSFAAGDQERGSVRAVGAGLGVGCFCVDHQSAWKMAAGIGSPGESFGLRMRRKPKSFWFLQPSTRRQAIAESRAFWWRGERGISGRQEGRQARHSRFVHLRVDSGDVRVGREQIMGEAGKGYKVAIETLNEGRIGIAAQMLGLAEGALDHSLRYARERKQFGKRIGDFQGVQFELAEMATRSKPHG